MLSRSPRSLIAWSVVGLIAAHQAAYVVVYRDLGHVTRILEATGHGWLWLAPVLVLTAAMTALVVGLIGGEPVRSFRWRLAFLALIQVVAFVATELGERYVNGGAALHLSADDWLILGVGLVMQLAVALLLALASGVVASVAAALAKPRTRHPSRRPGRVSLPSTASFRRALTPGRGYAPRAPPVRV